MRPILLVALAVAVPFPVGAADLLEGPHRGMACTSCHVSEPLWSADASETAPLVEGFSCLTCHEEEASASVTGRGDTPFSPPPQLRDLQWCTPYIGLEASQDGGTGEWTVTVDYGVPDGEVAVSLSVFVACVDDSTPACVSPRACVTLNEPACDGFVYGPTWRCLSKLCVFGPIPPGPFTIGPLDLPPRSDPYKIHAYLIHAPGTGDDCPPHFYTYECCETEIVTAGTGADSITQHPSRYALFTPRPNPSTEGATISFDAPQAGRVTVQIFDVMGQLVTTVLDGPVGPGRHTRVWAGRDAAGHTVSPGVYFVRLDSGEFVTTSKLTRIE